MEKCEDYRWKILQNRRVDILFMVMFIVQLDDIGKYIGYNCR